MLKKKRKCKRKKEEGNLQNIIGQMTPSMMTSYRGRHPTRLTQNVLGSISIYGKSF
jgi:hypothetical protein